jgi:NH3-dependent NAD+ synthetase
LNYLRLRRLTEEERIDLARAKAMKAIKAYVNAEPGSSPVLPDYITGDATYRYLPTWADKKFDITLQNMQARARLPVPWAIANDESKIAEVSSNKSEAIGYTTAGGDLHMGGINSIGGISKFEIAGSEDPERAKVWPGILRYLETHGLCGLEPMPSLYWINQEKPSAELRKEVSGKQQTDEADLGFSYEQSDFIEANLLTGRNTPLEVFKKAANHPLFQIGRKKLHGILMRYTKMWPSAQFKRIFSPHSPHEGGNVDPQQSLRTTLLGDNFKTMDANMTLHVLAEELGGEPQFKSRFGMDMPTARVLASVNEDFKTALIKWPIDQLLNPNEWQKFEQSNAQFTPYVAQASQKSETPSVNRTADLRM